MVRTQGANPNLLDLLMDKNSLLDIINHMTSHRTSNPQDTRKEGNKKGAELFRVRDTLGADEDPSYNQEMSAARKQSMEEAARLVELQKKKGGFHEVYWGLGDERVLLGEQRRAKIQREKTIKCEWAEGELSPGFGDD
ncbi:hypothetical protein RND71_005274 [Anisodus tanguticus]|uniref:Uncharacterized protein n=1 Tax=Anisodus tanguticus TaxID=243964 RepID=A0AAE1SSK7_9SOLA|nr:hypothetical protein RND71_005274 [Anisodus tanguticus]